MTKQEYFEGKARRKKVRRLCRAFRELAGRETNRLTLAAMAVRMTPEERESFAQEAGVRPPSEKTWALVVTNLAQYRAA